MERLVNAILGRAPHWLLNIIEWMIARDSRLIRWVKGRAAAGIPIPDPILPEPAEVRVFFAPFNYAGQAWQWARSLASSSERISAKNLTVVAQRDFGFESDGRVPAAVFAGSAQWQARQREALEAYTHVAIESFTSTLGAGRGRGLAREIDWHRAGGRRVALICHGTDIRSPELHARRSQHSPFDLSDRATQRLQRRVDENKRILETFDGPVYFSTPDLVHDVPHGIWLPLVIDPQRWADASARVGVRPGERAVPVVMHAPTSAKLKGTEAVERAIEALGDEVDYRPVSGVPAAEMSNHVAAADVVIDQLLLGSYGVAACEAMAAGRVVVGNVDAHVRDLVRERAGMELPIVQADPDDLEEVLRRLARNPEEMREHALRGPDFVRAMHAGGFTSAAMRDFVGL